eukprot:Phypoly_transcript_15242.p1 GENE.Phypoly_transcript_15242~~Phypoly_transcript_15242.p1  ORF type:complete len:287 (+),score=33.54 Phypoly_transcript_15242:69-929(+)
MRGMCITKLLIVVLFVVGLTGAPVSNLPAHVSTFVVAPGTKERFSVQLDAASVSATCKLEYDTSVLEETETGKTWPSADKVLDQMNRQYGCIRHEAGAFIYEVCLGEEVRQVANNGDVYTLGKYDRVVEGSSYTQLYTKGTFCEAAHTDRKVILEFTCADEAAVNSVSEHALCQYRIVVGAPEVCGHPQFSGVTSKAETWVLELTETDEGSVICQAYNNGLDAVGTTNFQAFTLSIDSPNYSMTNYVIRNKGRKAAPESELIKKLAPASLSIRKRMQIDYAKIVAE